MAANRSTGSRCGPLVNIHEPCGLCLPAIGGRVFGRGYRYRRGVGGGGEEGGRGDLRVVVG